MNVLHLEPQFKNFALFERGMGIASYKSIRSEIQALVEFTSTHKLSELSTAAIRSYLVDGRMQKGWTPKTFRNKWQSLKSFFDWCVHRKYLSTNPVVLITRPKLGTRLPRCLSHDDAKKVLAVASWHPWRSELEQTRNLAILSTLMMAGLRLNEMLMLSESDVDLKAGSILIRYGKGDKERYVPIYPRLMATLLKYRKLKQARGKPSTWFFTGLHSDKRLYPKDVRRICEIIGLIADVFFRPHMLRHTFARELADNDLDVMKIKELLGHAQVTTTQTYIALSMNRLIKSMNEVRMY